MNRSQSILKLLESNYISDAGINVKKITAGIEKHFGKSFKIKLTGSSDRLLTYDVFYEGEKGGEIEIDAKDLTLRLSSDPDDLQGGIFSTNDSKSILKLLPSNIIWRLK